MWKRVWKLQKLVWKLARNSFETPHDISGGLATPLEKRAKGTAETVGCREGASVGSVVLR
jgi:hypothetical protein